ncbi:hypothetical protein RHMOL_Rhmol04G0279700 [Rhododendron molle]|uniref:Uncharacterized protein n=1 Tax=Rhododendron molle TaxID=49168 RepID=A0ACC0P4Y8_RHOML|nr:hypothetical protein RHMOL_Rhmol04G0279700 [Rhododendron molle]
MSNDIWEYVQDGFEDYVETLTNEQKKQMKVDNRMNAKALSMIQQAASNRFSFNGALKLGTKRVLSNRCRASRRRVLRYNDEEEEEEDEEYGYNAEIAMLEIYSQSARDEALMVRALVDEEEAEVLIFRKKNSNNITLGLLEGFSSSLSYRTSPDPSRSILPARAVIKSIDRVRGPFDPSNIGYLEKGLTWDAFKSRLQAPAIVGIVYYSPFIDSVMLSQIST